MNQIEIIKNAFRAYYFNYAHTLIDVPEKIAGREFGFSLFEGKGMQRHESFSNMREFLARVIMEVPADIYCSNALYRFPKLPMQEKQWQGADLIFDIDGKDLNLPCQPSHTFSICSNCKHVSKGEHIKYSCCQEPRTNKISIPCENCVMQCNSEVSRLVNLLTDKLGIEIEHIRVYFSGNNGFHVHVDDPAYRALDSQARADLARFLSGAVKIDPQVTTDIHRVFRMPGTINSKSSLLKSRVLIPDIPTFDPFSDACFIGDAKTQVKMRTDLTIRIKKEDFYITQGEDVRLPAYCAIYLMCKGVADVSG